MKSARFRDGVKQLAWEDEDSDSNSKLMAIMDAQLDKLETAEEIKGFVSVMRCRISRRTRDRSKTLDEWGTRRLVK